MKSKFKYLAAMLSIFFAVTSFADVDLRPSPNIAEVLREEHVCLIDAVVAEGATSEAAVHKCVRYGFGALRHSAFVASQRGITLVPGTADGDMWKRLAVRNAAFWLGLALKQCSGTLDAESCKSDLKLN